MFIYLVQIFFSKNPIFLFPLCLHLFVYNVRNICTLSCKIFKRIESIHFWWYSSISRIINWIYHIQCDHTKQNSNFHHIVIILYLFILFSMNPSPTLIRINRSDVEIIETEDGWVAVRTSAVEEQVCTLNSVIFD